MALRVCGSNERHAFVGLILPTCVLQITHEHISSTHTPVSSAFVGNNTQNVIKDFPRYHKASLLALLCQTNGSLTGRDEVSHHGPPTA